MEQKLNELLGQINPEQAREEFRSASKSNGGSGVKDFMDGMGLGLIADQVNIVSKCPRPHFKVLTFVGLSVTCFRI